MRTRQPSRQGLSYYDANRQRLITEGPDVLGIKSEILARWPGVLDCFFDTWDEEWVIVEKCKDGVDRHVLSTKRLGQWVIDKLQREDEAAHYQPDMVQKLEKEEEDEERRFGNRIYEAFGESHERLLSALKKDGIGGQIKVFYPSKDAA